TCRRSSARGLSGLRVSHQLAEWTGFGHLTRSSRGRDILNTPQVLGLVVVLAARFPGVPRSQLLPRS
ncbi:MAG TPA: hypothetical protein VHS32_21820, partial [Streptosporangiaceae bacterium]|nr:hypothetical protein [Streptosporangiaceae bacterium]